MRENKNTRCISFFSHTCITMRGSENVMVTPSCFDVFTSPSRSHFLYMLDVKAHQASKYLRLCASGTVLLIYFASCV
jgi:hypothetical protein